MQQMQRIFYTLLLWSLVILGLCSGHFFVLVWYQITGSAIFSTAVKLKEAHLTFVELMSEGYMLS